MMHECFPWRESCESILKNKTSPKIINFFKFYFLFSYIKLETYLIASKSAFIRVILRAQFFY